MTILGDASITEEVATLSNYLLIWEFELPMPVKQLG
jgi:hypothetical protein